MSKIKFMCEKCKSIIEVPFPKYMDKYPEDIFAVMDVYQQYEPFKCPGCKRTRVDFQIFEDDPKDIPEEEATAFFQIDNAIAEDIQLLNAKGYETAFSCQGHVKGSSAVESIDPMYIMFSTNSKIETVEDLRILNLGIPKNFDVEVNDGPYKNGGLTLRSHLSERDIEIYQELMISDPDRVRKEFNRYLKTVRESFHKWVITIPMR